MIRTLSPTLLCLVLTSGALADVDSRNRSDTEALLAFAETQYAEFFSPPTQEIQELEGYQVRDLTDVLLFDRAASCAEYAGEYSASVTDVKRSLNFAGTLEIAVSDGLC